MRKIIDLFKQLTGVELNKKLLKQSLIVGSIYLLIFLTFFTLISFFEITQEGIQNYVAGLGVFSVLVYVISVILMAMTPFPDEPIIASGVIIFGITTGFVLIWFSLVVTGIINFTISKRLGRNFFIKKFPEVIKYADRFAEKNGLETIIIARVFTFVTFDTVSYAAGLTNMSYRKFIIATVVGILPIAINYTFVGAALSTGNFLATIFAFVISALIAITLGISAKFIKSKFLKDLD